MGKFNYIAPIPSFHYKALSIALTNSTILVDYLNGVTSLATTIFDIAKKAGVSITTVSRALNGLSDVNEKTRQRIIKIAGELDYYPSAAARHLQGKKTNTIAYAPIMHEDDGLHPFLKEFLGMLAIACFKHDLSLLVVLAEHDRSPAEVYRELAGTGRVDGVILADVQPQDERTEILGRLGLPFVAFGRTANFLNLAYPFVDVDGAAGIGSVVTYLQKVGHRRIAYFSDPFLTSWAYYRYDGYCEALRAGGLMQNLQLEFLGIESPAEAARAIVKVMGWPESDRPTALVASHDLMALNLIQSLQEQNIPVGKGPGQIAVSGYDDLPFAAFLNPTLTTLRQPIASICNLLLDVLVDVLKKDEIQPEAVPCQATFKQLGARQFLVEPELITRESA